jgi:serine/threonine protein kinase/formylglycine-generating enzyme required for sulfatase activity
MSTFPKDPREPHSSTPAERATPQVNRSTHSTDVPSHPFRPDLEATAFQEGTLVDGTQVDQVDLPFDDTIDPTFTDRDAPLRAHLVDIERTHLSTRYERQELLGEGGMGTVYRVFDHHLMRSVALKELKGPHGVSSESQRAHFIKEAQILAQLNHPGIIPIYDLHTSSPDHDSSSTRSSVSAQDNALFFTMEEFKGQTLEEMIDQAQRCHRGILAKTLKLLLTALVDIARAVAYAHSKGIIHRDLKPQNVMIGQYGRVSVLDWGLGGVEEVSNTAPRDEETSRSADHLVRSDPALTYTGLLSGTPAYMSPEQARCESLDEFTDIYSLGAVLYQCLSSIPPYTDIHPILSGQEIVSLLCKNIHPTPIRSLSTRYHSIIPNALYTLCEKAMSLNPTDRPSSMEAFADEIEEIIFGEERRILANQARGVLLSKIATHWFAELKRRRPSSQWERIQSTHSPLPFLMNRHAQSLIQINLDDPSDYESTIDRIALAFDAVIYLFNHHTHSTHLPSIMKTLHDAAQLLQEQRSLLRAEGIEVDWSEIEYLARGENLVSLTCQAPQELDEWTRATLKVTDIPSYNEDPEELDSREVEVYWAGALTACPTLSLSWGHYQAEVTLDGHRYIHLFDVSPLRCLSLFKEGLSPLVNAVLDLRQREHKGEAPLTPFWGLLDADPQCFERQEISLPIAILSSLTSNFNWVSKGKVRLGSALPLPNSELPSMRELEGLWMQTTQVSSNDYMEYLNDLRRLTLMLYDESRGTEWLSKEVPLIHIKVTGFYNKRLFEWSETSQCFAINEALRAFDHHESMPITWITFGQAFRYSLWFTWRSKARFSLPTEAEWEKSARGIDARLFPWGHDAWDSACNHGQLTNRRAPVTKTELIELYRYDISPYGVRGLGGGASDWTISQSLYREMTSAQINRELNELVSDPFHAQDERDQFTYLINTLAWNIDDESYDIQNSTISLMNVIRGGSWVNSIEHCLTTYRFKSLNYKSYGDVSFRLVHRPQEAQGGTQ